MLALVVLATRWIAYVPVGSAGWALIVLSILAFNLGAVLPKLGSSPHRQHSLSRYRFTGFTYVLPALFTIGLAFYLHAVISQFGLHSLLSAPSDVRSKQASEEFIAGFPLVARLCYFLGPLVFIAYANPRLSGVCASKRVRWLLLGFVIVALAASLGRTLVLVALTWQSGVVYLSRKRPGSSRSSAKATARRWAAFATMILLAAVMFQVVAVFVGKDASSDSRVQPYVRGRLQGSRLTSVVLYTSGELPTLGRLAADPRTGRTTLGGQRAGWATFGTVVKLIPGWRATDEISGYAHIPFPFNAYTWLEPFFRDFGTAGVIGLPFLVGALVGVLVVRPRRSTYGVLGAALCIGLTVWAPFVNKFTSTFTWEYAVILGWLALLSRSTPVTKAAADHGLTHRVSAVGISGTDSRP
jgi:hypothetical protein